MSHSFVRIALCFIVMLTCSASATSIFTEDFESYTTGSDLNGQGGWYGNGSIFVDNLNGSNAIGGSNEVGSGIHTLRNDVSFDSAYGIYTLSFDGGAQVGPNTHDAGIALSATGETPDGTERFIGFNHHFTDGWFFRPPDWSSPTFDFAGTLGDDGVFEILVDATALEAWGRADFGGGWIETPRYGISTAELNALDGVIVWQNVGDSAPSSIIDNIALTHVPEPSGLLGFGLGFLCLIARRRKAC